MTNINKAKKYVPVLDKIYQNSALTSDLDGDNSLVKEGANAGELLVAKFKMQGLADYDRGSGYTAGTVDLTWETIKADFDRGRMFTVDNVDNKETIDLAFGQLAGEFIRTKVTPELDAYRFSKYASTTGVTTVKKALATGEELIKALRTAVNTLDENEVPTEQRFLYITPTLLGMIEDLDTTKSRDILSGFSMIKKVPQTRFYTKIKQEKTNDGGFKPAVGGFKINFMIIEKSAVIQHPKHIAPKIVSPEANQNADAWKFGYRQVSVAQVYENKLTGVYVHHDLTEITAV